MDACDGQDEQRAERPGLPHPRISSCVVAVAPSPTSFRSPPDAATGEALSRACRHASVSAFDPLLLDRRVRAMDFSQHVFRRHTRLLGIRASVRSGIAITLSPRPLLRSRTAGDTPCAE